MSSRREIHPNDRALLYDLVDGRLAPRAQDEVRRRIDEEPELRAAHDELVELRRRLAALPVPALPADFLERVRARAGFPALADMHSRNGSKSPAAAAVQIAKPETVRERPLGATSPVESVPASERAGSNSSSTAAAVPLSVGPRPQLGRVLAFARVAYGVAAVLVVALGVMWWKFGSGEVVNEASLDISKQAAREASDQVSSTNSAGAASGGGATGKLEAVAEDKLRTAENVAAKDSIDGRSARKFGPIGAAPSGARTPSDSPDSPSRPSSSPPIRTEVAPAGSAGEGARTWTGETTSVTSGLVVSSAVFEGADDVLVVYADSLDGSRAEISVLVSDARAGRALDVSRLLKSSRDSVLAGFVAGGKSTRDRQLPRTEEKADVPAAPRGSPGYVPTPVPPAELGSFLVELDEPALARLSRSLVEAQSDQPQARKLDEHGVVDSEKSRGTPGATVNPDPPRESIPAPAPVPTSSSRPAAPPVIAPVVDPQAPSPPPPPAASPPEGAPVEPPTSKPAAPNGEDDPKRTEPAASGGAPRDGERATPEPELPALDATKSTPALRRVRIVVLPRGP